jgi:spore germination cell wall hydrolase CwlJ-like protein
MIKAKLVNALLTSKTSRTAARVALIAPTPILVGLAACGFISFKPTVEHTEVIEPVEVVQYRDVNIGGRQVTAHNLDCGTVRKDDLICLTCNIYEESRDQPLAGQILVAKTTMNRAKATGDSVCKTVWRHKQFSWTNFPLGKKPVKELDSWRRALEVAHLVMTEYGKAKSTDVNLIVMAGGQANNDIKWYHTQEVAPKWRKELDKVTVIGDHVFYKKG